MILVKEEYGDHFMTMLISMIKTWMTQQMTTWLSAVIRSPRLLYEENETDIELSGLASATYFDSGIMQVLFMIILSLVQIVDLCCGAV